MKNKLVVQGYLTPTQFLKLPLNQAIPYVIRDVNRFRRKGVDINMSDWAVAGRSGNLCSVCVGGAAVLGFYNGQLPELIKAQQRRELGKLKGGYSVLITTIGPDNEYRAEFDAISDVFNMIRSCDYYYALKAWLEEGADSTRADFLIKRLNKNLKLKKAIEDMTARHVSISGFVGKEKIAVLFRQMRELASLLEVYHL